LSTTEIPSHTHANGLNSPRAGGPPGPQTAVGGSTALEGGGGAHSHPSSVSTSTFSTTLDLRVQYVDVIICSKS
jgi:hypothetical protein